MRRIGVLTQPLRGRSGRPGPQCGVPARAAAIGLDGWPQRADRLSLGRRRQRPQSQICGRIGRARTGCHPGHWQPTLEPLQQATRTVPIVFVQITDPVGAGFVDSLARPGGNATGFAIMEYGASGKWLELLKEIVPNVKRVAVLRDSATTAGIGQFAGIQRGASVVRVELRPVDVRDPAEIERAIDAFARDPNGGMIVTPSGLAIVHRKLIIALAARYRLPAIYGQRFFRYRRRPAYLLRA